MARLRHPDLRVLSGFSEQETILQDRGPKLGKLLQNPFMPTDLRREVAEALAANER